MQVQLGMQDGQAHIRLEPDQGEAARLHRRTATVATAPGWSPDEVHPDLLALALLLLCRPVTDASLQLPRAVSSGFAAAAHRLTGLTLTPVDDQLPARVAPETGVPGLCFSGGVDSVAALTVLPDTTRCYFLERRVPAGARARLLTPEAGLGSVAGVRELGVEVRVVPTDLEYLRDPPGFPEHYANAVPVLLHADRDGIATIGWGLVLESAYRIGRARYVDYLDRAYNRRWHGLFAAAGLPMHNPVMGVSEVGTSRLAAEGPYAGLAQSCVRGPLGAPCGACVKCFRKQVVTAAILDAWPDDDVLRGLLSAYSVRSYLAAVPLLQPAGLLWSLQRYPGRDPVLLALRARLEVAQPDVGFVVRWYPAARAHWPAVPWVDEVTAVLDERLGRMSTADEHALRTFDIAVTEQRPEVAGYAEAVALLADRRAELLAGHAVKPSVTVASGIDPAVVEELERELAVRTAQLAAVRASTSYRLGHALVRPFGRLHRRR